MTFVLLISLIIIIFVVIFDYFVGYIQAEFASKRPRLESWGLNTDSWLGSVHHSRERDKSLVLDTVLNQGSNLGDQGLSTVDDGPGQGQLHSRNDKLEIDINERDFISNEIFNDFLSPREECIRLMTRVEEFLDRDSSISSRRHVHRLSRDAGGLSTEYLAAVKAISSQLMVNYDGTMKPITFRQKLFYRDRQDLIEKKLANARVKALKICESINEMEVLDNNLKDIALMRKFILEQVSAIYRFSLRKNFKDIDGVPPEIIRPSLWLAAWITIIFVLIFFLYWIFAWGVKNGGATLDLWGTNYAVSIVQDILVLEVCKVCIIYVLVIMSTKPQLQVIKRVINDRALSLAQEGAEFNEEVSVVQHFSPSCRAARTSVLSKLPASAILRSITDDDVEKCKEHKNFNLGSIIFYTIMLAAVVAALNEILIDQLLTFILSSMLLAFLLVNTKLLAISPILLAVIYLVIGGAILYNLFVFIPSVKRARQARAKRAQAAREFARARSLTTADKRKITFTENLIRGFRTLITRLVEHAGHLHSIISDESAERLREKNRNETLIWCGMNKAVTVQGDINLQSEAAMRSRVVEELCSFKYSKRNSIEYTIPPAILRMRQSGIIFCRHDSLNTLEDRFSIHIFGSLSDQTSVKPKLSIPAVQSPRSIGKLAISYMANMEITTDPQVALKRMLQRHLLGAESYRNGEECSAFDLDEASNNLICMSELTEMLSWIWGTFYPGGLQLSSEVKLEVDANFQRWKELSERPLLHSTNSSEIVREISRPSFTEFSDWFLEACNGIEILSVPTRQCNDHHRSSYIFQRNRMEWVIDTESDQSSLHEH